MKAPAQSSLDLSLFWRGDRIALRCLDRPGEASLGDRPGSLGRIPGVGEGFVVARRSARETLVCVPSSTTGTLRRQDGTLASIEGPASISLAPGEELSLAFGDFKRGYLIVGRVGVRMLRDPYSSKPYVLFYTTKRVGGGVQNFEAIKELGGSR